MPFQSHLRDFSTAKACKNTCLDCPKRLAQAAQTDGHMGRTLPSAAPEVLTDLHHRAQDKFAQTAQLITRSFRDVNASDGRL